MIVSAKSGSDSLTRFAGAPSKRGPENRNPLPCSLVYQNEAQRSGFILERTFRRNLRAFALSRMRRISANKDEFSRTQNAASALRFGGGAFFGIPYLALPYPKRSLCAAFWKRRFYRNLSGIGACADTRHSGKTDEDERITVLPLVGSSFSGCGDTGQIIKIIGQRRTLTDKQ